MARKPLGQRIRQYRLENGLTLRDLGSFFGVAPSTIERLIRGEKCHELTRVKIERKLDKVQPPQVAA